MPRLQTTALLAVLALMPLSTHAFDLLKGKLDVEVKVVDGKVVSHDGASETAGRLYVDMFAAAQCCPGGAQGCGYRVGYVDVKVQASDSAGGGTKDVYHLLKKSVFEKTAVGNFAWTEPVAFANVGA